MLSSLSNQAIFFLEYFYLKNYQKNTYLHSHFHDEREFHHCFSSSLHDYVLRRHSSKTFLYWRKILISLKRHTFNFKHYVHKTYLHKRFILFYIQITRNNNKKYFEKFIEELDFVELATQVKHLRLNILHDDRLNDRPQYYC